MKTIILKVADVPFALHTDDWHETTQCLPSYPAFHITPAQSKELSEDFAFEMDVNLHDVDITPDDESLLKFEASDLNNEILRRKDGGYKFVIALPDGTQAAIGECNDDYSRFNVKTIGTMEARSCGLNNLIMMAFAFASASRGVLLVHSSVVFHKGAANLFLGKSGTGKSTHSRLWMENIAETELLNDDNPAVRAFADGRMMVYGTPWSGKTPCYRNLQFPINAIVSLHQAPANDIKRLNAIHAFSAFFPSCSMIKWDDRNRAQVISNVEAVVKHVPVYSLDCLPNAEAALLCQQTVEGGGRS